MFIQILTAGSLFAQGVDFGVGMDPGSFRTSKPGEKEEPVTDPLIGKIALHFKQSSDKLHALWYRGYGYLELIRLSMMAESSKTPFDDIIKLRDKGEKLSAIAGKYQLPYRDIYSRSFILKDILEAQPDDILLSATTEQLKNSATNYQVINSTTQGK